MQFLARFFDGATQQGECGGGMFLRINVAHNYKLWIIFGQGTNTREKLLTFRGLLNFATNIGLASLEIFKDSKWLRIEETIYKNFKSSS